MQIHYRPNGAAPTPLTSLSMDPRGRTIACGTMNSEVLLLEASTGKPRRALKGHEAMVSSVVFAEGGKAIFSTSWDCTTRRWTARGADKNAPEMKHKAEVKTVAINENSARGAAGARNGIVKIFAVDSLRCFRNIQAQFAVHSKFLSNFSGPLFKGSILVNYELSTDFKAPDLKIIIPGNISKLIHNNDENLNYVGAYPNTM